MQAQTLSIPEPDPNLASSPGGEPPDKNAGYFRHPLIAAVMSACLPGWGQLYNGQVNRALWLFVAFCLVVGPLGALFALWLPTFATAPAMSVWLLASIVLWLWNIADAWRQAPKIREPLRPWQVSGLYAAVFLISVGLILPTVITQVRTKLVHPVRVVSNSMAPTLLAGDQVFVNMRVNCMGCSQSLQRGDIVVFTFPNNRSQLHIKRLIALPGDEVTVGKGRIAVNGETSLGAQEQSIDDQDEEAMQRLVVPNGHAFVVGDNWQHSKDSRDFGPVSLRDIHGKARQVYFSRGADGIRWSRIGHPLE